MVSPSSTAYSCRHCRGLPPNQRGTTTAVRHLHRCCTQPSTPGKKHTYTELTRGGGVPTRGLGPSNLADASATKQPVSAAHLHKHGPALPPHTYGQPPSRHWLVVGPHFLRMRHTPFLQQARPPTTWQPTTTSMGTPPSLATSSATPPRHPHQPLG